MNKHTPEKPSLIHCVVLQGHPRQRSASVPWRMFIYYVCVLASMDSSELIMVWKIWWICVCMKCPHHGINSTVGPLKQSGLGTTHYCRLNSNNRTIISTPSSMWLLIYEKHIFTVKADFSEEHPYDWRFIMRFGSWPGVVFVVICNNID